MKTATPLIVLIVPFLLAGCGGSTGGPKAARDLELPERYFVRFRADADPHRSTVPAPLAQVEEAIPFAYRQVGFPVGRAGGGDNLFITPTLRIKSQLYEGERTSKYIDCGSGPGGPRADLYQVEFVLLTRLRPDGGERTIVETILDGRAKDRAVSAYPVACRGTGRLEGEIAELLRRRVSS